MSAARTDDGASPRRLKRRLKRILSVAGLSLLTLAGLVVAVLLAWRAYEQHRIREATKITSRSGIESLEKVPLGGVEKPVANADRYSKCAKSPDRAPETFTWRGAS